MKNAVILIGALLPVAYCAWLLNHFWGVAGSIEEVQALGLGPTMLGLALVGGLFCVAFLVKLVRIFVQMRSPAPIEHRSATASARDNNETSDADAVLARYMAQRSTEPTSTSSTNGAAQGPRPTFGRKVR